jgi:Galactose oxidase-like, Early set domain/Bacterial Ig domain
MAGSAAAHDVSTPGGHAQEDFVVHDRATEGRLNQQTKVTSAAASRAAATATGTEDEVGQWGPVVDWPVVAVHTALLPNGKVLAYDSIGDHATETYPDQTYTRATVWDPATGSQTDVRVNTGYNIFCSGLAHLLDGSLFIAGGNKDQALNGIVQTHLFNPASNTWSLGPNMAAGRWYPSVTPLSNGEMLITEGGPDIPEVRRTDGNLRSLSSASRNLPLYPWMDVAPNGRTFVSGPDPTMFSLDTAGTGSWATLAQRDGIARSYGSHAFYDIGKILVSGGAASEADSRVIDLNGSTPQVSATSPMAFGRRQHNLTVLADGSVLATGGNSSGAALVDMNAGVYPAELWNPAAGSWKTLASMAVTRQYHSTALLLPDGRVLSAGGGICGTCDQVGYLAKNAEVFTPPYLFKKDGSGQLAPRPTIDSAPSSAGYGSQIQIATPDAASIQKVALVRLGAVTHSVNMEQRYVPLSFTAGSSSLAATVPANVNVAPPGFYMLFIVDGAGVPSVAKMVRLDATAPPPPPPSNQPPSVSLTSPSDGATFTQPAKIDLAASASDPDGTLTNVSFYDGSKLIAQDTTAPYSYRWNVAAVGNHVLTARATDNAGATTTSSPVTITLRRKR